MASNLPTHLTITDAPLPQTYEKAKTALADCQRLDECKDWADKAAALRSYARQSEDDTLEKLAMRIRSQAIRRCGELLAEHDARGDHRKTVARDSSSNHSQRQAAHAAGMSERQQVTAVRVANVPRETFDALVESDAPPTVTRLAEIGKKGRADPDWVHEPKPAGFQEALYLFGVGKEFAEYCGKYAPEFIAGGFQPHEVPPMRKRAETIIAWLDRLVINLKDSAQ